MELTSIASQSFASDSVAFSSVNVCYSGTQDCPPGHSWGPGSRSEYLLHHICSGHGIYRVNGTEYSLQAGDTFLAHPGDSIFYQADENDPWSYCWVAFNGSECRSLLLLTDFGANVRVLHTDFRTDLRNCIYDIHAKHGYTVSASLEMTAGFYRLIACLVRYSVKPNLDVTQSKKTLQDITRYISMKIFSGEGADDLSVKTIAEHANMSESSLYRLFTAQLGVSPIQYITKTRIEQACKLLVLSEQSITSVAYSVGYPNGQCFAKNFRKVMKLSPSEYIKLHTGE